MRRMLIMGAVCLALPLAVWGCGEGEASSDGAVRPAAAEPAEAATPEPTDGGTDLAVEPTELEVGAAEPAIEVVDAQPGIAIAPDAAVSASVAETAAAYAPVYGGGVTSQDGISVAGTGQVHVVPDAAQITFGVDTQADTADAALAANAQAMAKVIAALLQAGIARKDVQTQQVSVGQRYDQQGVKVIGYSASNQVVATARTIDATGAVMDAAVKAGATNVYGLGLVVSNPDEAYAKALDQAVAAARAKAERLAKAAGVTLGKVVGLAEGGGGYGGPIPLAAEAAGDAKTPIEVGTQLVTASVTVTYAVA